MSSLEELRDIYETSTSLKMGLRRMKKWLTYARLIFGKTADTLEAPKFGNLSLLYQSHHQWGNGGN